MLDILTNPLVLAILIGPIAGILWTKILNADSRKDVDLLKGPIEVSNSGNITASDEGNIQIGHGNKVTNHNYNRSQPSKSQGDGEAFFFVVFGLIAAILYIRYQEWALGFSFLFLLFNLAFTLCYIETKKAKSIKTIAYGVLFFLRTGSFILRLMILY